MSSQVEVRLDVPYGGGPDGKLCNDVYLPAGPGPHPALFCLHGGAWARGSHRQYQEWGPWLAARGYALVAVTTGCRRMSRRLWRLQRGNSTSAALVMEEAPAALVEERLGSWANSAGGQWRADALEDGLAHLPSATW